MSLPPEMLAVNINGSKTVKGVTCTATVFGAWHIIHRPGSIHARAAAAFQSTHTQKGIALFCHLAKKQNKSCLSDFDRNINV